MIKLIILLIITIFGGKLLTRNSDNFTFYGISLLINYTIAFIIGLIIIAFFV